jgi:hypothetical protein
MKEYYASLFSTILGWDLQLRLPEIVRVILSKILTKTVMKYEQRTHDF